MPKTKWFLRIAACAGVLSVITMEAGWVVTEVGRQPWIVHDYMKVEDAATANTGVWITFLAVFAIYAVLGVTTILVLRGMSRRWREAGDADESDVPYGPSDPGILGGPRPRGSGRMNLEQHASRSCCSSASPRTRCSAAPTSAPGSGTCIAGGAERGERPRALIDHSIGPVWEANHVWLIFCLVVLWTAFSPAFASITLTLFVPLTLAAFGIVLRGSSFAFRKVVLRTRDRRNFGAAFALVVGARAVLHGRGRRRDRVGPGAVRRRGRQPVDELDQSHFDHRRPARDRGVRVPVGGVPRLGRAPARRSTTSSEYFRRRAIAASVVAGVDRVRRDLRVPLRRALPLRRPHVARAAARDRVGRCAVSASLVLLVRGVTRPARGSCSVGAVATVVVGWGVAQWPYMLPESLKVSQAAAPDGTLEAVLVVFVFAAVVILPSLGAALRARPEELAARRRRA